MRQMYMHSDHVELNAFAKINLSLDVVGRRDDGYHDIVSVMQDIGLHDDIRMTGRSESLSDNCCFIDGVIVDFCIDTDTIPTGMENLALRGASAIIGADPDRAAKYSPYRIEIDKNLPVAAGIAGGSGNAAVTMLAMDRLMGYPFTMRELMEIGAGIGADVPFSIMMNAKKNEKSLERLTGIEEASLAALMHGIGDIVDPISPHPYHVVLMNPGTGVSTADAYRAIDDMTGYGDGEQGLFYNIFEKYTYEVCEPAARMRGAMRENFSAEHISMSGSGPTIAAYYRDSKAAETDYMAALSGEWMEDGWKMWKTTTGGVE